MGYRIARALQAKRWYIEFDDFLILIPVFVRRCFLKTSNPMHCRREMVSKVVATLPDDKICDYIDQKIRNDTPMARGIFAGRNISLQVIARLNVLAATVPTFRAFLAAEFGTKYAPSCCGLSLTSARIAIGSSFAEDPFILY
jgi:hypothetical protein